MAQRVFQWDIYLPNIKWFLGWTGISQLTDFTITDSVIFTPWKLWSDASRIMPDFVRALRLWNGYGWCSRVHTEPGKTGKIIYFENKLGKPGKILVFWNFYAFFRIFLEFYWFLIVLKYGSWISLLNSLLFPG